MKLDSPAILSFYSCLRACQHREERLQILAQTLRGVIGTLQVEIYIYNSTEGCWASIGKNDNSPSFAKISEWEILYFNINSNEKWLNHNTQTAFVLRTGNELNGLIILNTQIPLPGEKECIEYLCLCYSDQNSLGEFRENNVLLATQLGRASHNLSLILSLSEAVSQAQDLNHLLSIILNLASAAVNADRGFILIKNDRQTGLEVLAAKGLTQEEKLRQGSIISVVGTYHQHLLGTKKPVILSGFRLFEENLSGIEGNSSSIMGVPLVIKENPLGLIYLSKKVGETCFADEDKAVATILSSYAANVVDQAKLYTLSVTDELTSLYTRRYFIQRMGEETRRAERYNRCLSLALIDIDFFKKINDTYGHLAGDFVLRSLALHIKKLIRKDIDMAIRYGGEEFVLVMPETPILGAKVAAERILKEIQYLEINFENISIPVTVSMGVSSFPENNKPIQELLKQADEALYISKSQGRNRITLFPEC